MACDTCRYLDQYKEPYREDYIGVCRRHAPSPSLHHVNQLEQPQEPWWPMVRATDYCGEWVVNPSLLA